MPNPTRSSVHIDQPLTNISIAYRQDANNFIADQVFPRVPVSKQSDKYFTYDIGDFYRTDAQKRAPGTESAGSGWRMSTDSYFCDVWAVHKDVDDQTRANADTGINLDKDASDFCMLDILIRKEVDWVTHFFSTSLWTGSTTATDITPGNLWDTVAGTPIDDIAEQSDSIAKKTGYKPNTLVLGPEVFKELKEHPDILDRIKYTQTGVVTRDILAGLFEVDRVLVPYAVRNTAAEEATDSYSFIYGKHALLCYVAPNPGLMTPSAGYSFVWSGLGNNAYGQAVSKFRMDHLKADRVELEAAFDHKQVGANLGVFFSSAVS